MFIAIAPNLLAVTRTAMLLWTLATNGNTYFVEVPSCAPYEARNETCISVFQTKSLPEPYAGKTWRWGNQYVSLVLNVDALVIAHEIAHVVLGMAYHSAPNTSITSPYLGNKCFSVEDTARYQRMYGKEMKVLCLK